jgi:hypothetical protein
MTTCKDLSKFQKRNSLLAVIAAVAICGLNLQATPLSVPNFSFESQTAPNVYPYVNGNVDSWAKAPEPAYWLPLTGGFFPWDGTAGLFLDVNPYANHLGSQAGYILGFPQATLFQDYNSVDWHGGAPTHDFDQVFEIGKAYTLTIGVFGKNTLTPGSTLKLSLYYVDNLNQHVDVGSTTITYSAAAFPEGPPWNLIDFNVNVGYVQASDAWAGQHIGIQLESTTPLPLASFGNWDFDNVRLEVVPEPGTFGLLAAGISGLLLQWARRRRQS